MSVIRRHPVAVVALVGLVIALVLAASSSRAMAQDGSGPSGGDRGQELPPPEMIPRPNTGREPEDAGDRGGSLQVLVLCVIVVAITGGVLLVVRESRRAKAAQRQ